MIKEQKIAFNPDPRDSSFVLRNDGNQIQIEYISWIIAPG
jgi:hypothetical protein